MANEQNDDDPGIGSMLNIHCFPLASQGNVYSMTKLCSLSGTNKILVASLKRKIYSLGYQLSSNKQLWPLVKEVLFTYIPSGAEIISLDVYNKHNFDEEFVIGITIIKASGEDSIERYLNIYSESAADGENTETSIETIAQNCLTVELTYTPYLLYHTVIKDRDIGEEVVWLISGSDYQLHMIREDKLNHGYTEFPLDKFFPELVDMQALVLWINVYYYDSGRRRLTAVCCECGLVKITMVDVDQLKIDKEWKLRYDRPVTSVEIFLRGGGRRRTLDQLSKHENKDDTLPNVNILIVNSLEPAILFMNVLRNGLKNDVILEIPENSDCILSSCIADLNMDGKNEILLGTYGHDIFVFSFNNNQWKLSGRRKFDAPVHSICYLDLTGDGVRELVVLTQRGVHILQHDPKKLKNLWQNRLEELMSHCRQGKEIKF